MSTADELERIAALHAAGHLDDDEYRDAKRRVLAASPGPDPVPVTAPPAALADVPAAMAPLERVTLDPVVSDGPATRGWYPDPADPRRLRFWNEENWTARTRLPGSTKEMFDAIDPQGFRPPRSQDLAPWVPHRQDAPRAATGSASTNGLAIASLVLGILWLWWVGSFLAVILGHIARAQIAEQHQSGDGLAVAGLVLGYIGVGILAVAVIFV